jgi:hypothetical protein
VTSVPANRPIQVKAGSPGSKASEALVRSATSANHDVSARVDQNRLGVGSR